MSTFYQYLSLYKSHTYNTLRHCRDQLLRHLVRVSYIDLVDVEPECALLLGHLMLNPDFFHKRLLEPAEVDGVPEF